MRQSSAHQARPRGGSQAPVPGGIGTTREQWLLLALGVAGAVALTAGLWLLRQWIVSAGGRDILAGLLVVLGCGAALSALTALMAFSHRVDRRAESVARLLDAVAAGNLAFHMAQPRGHGREARLAGAMRAAVMRLQGWAAGCRGALHEVDGELARSRTPMPDLRDGMLAATSLLAQLSRDARYLANTIAEQNALTDRACTLAALIGQSERDTAAFVERVQSAVQEAETALAACGTGVAELQGVQSSQREASERCGTAQQRVREHLVDVGKAARQLKLLALHGAMEAARAGARPDGEDAAAGGRGAEFRVVAHEVRRLAADLAATAESGIRAMDEAGQALAAVQQAAGEGARGADAARGAISLGSAAVTHAATVTLARVADDAALAEAGTELAILASAIRERVGGAAKGAGDVADRLAGAGHALHNLERMVRDIELALGTVGAALDRARAVLLGIAVPEPGAPASELPPDRPRRIDLTAMDPAA